MSYRFALCSEVFRTPIEETIRAIADIGFDGVEIAPFNVADDIRDVDADARRSLRGVAEDAGVRIVGLHWLLVGPEGLHLTTEDDAVRARTVEYLAALARFCGDVGGEVMILGSPKQRNLREGTTFDQAFERAATALRAVGAACADAGVRLLFEPLHANETDFIRTVEDADRLVEAVGHPAVGFMLDCKAMSGMPDGIEGTLRKHGARAGHFHTNQPDGKGPGMGDVDFAPIFRALADGGYDGWVSCEPFDYTPDSVTVGRTALETLRAAAAAAAR